MHVLITNDDGIHARGIRALADAVRRAGHRVSIFAPDSQRSAASHSISLSAPLRAEPVEYDGIDAFAVDGTPADCVRLGLYLTRETPVDFVISGINNGSNRGAAILYSGTVAAASEASLCGTPGMAVSLCSHMDDRYEQAAQLGVQVMEWAAAHPLPRGEIYNLNVPYGVQVKGIRPAVLSREYMTSPLYTRLPDGSYRLQNGEVLPEPEADSDFNINEAGYASLSIITWNRLSGVPMPAMDGLEMET